MTSLEDIQNIVLSPFQNHRQLSMREAETLSLELVGILCDSYCKNGDTLKYVARFLTQDTYQDILDERNLNKMCGYPMCAKAPERVRDPFSISDNTRKFLWENNPYAYLSTYCSKFHFRCSQFYQVQLSDEALFARTGVHLIAQSAPEEAKIADKYQITLFEELLREKASEDDVKSLIMGLKRLGIQNGEVESSENDQQMQEDLSKWLSDIKIVENKEPSILGDLTKEDSR
ncbi:hypothetical protein HG537_0C02270 [Torulaspora globosa]|uniref:RNA polymerase II subunit B1 CTD phosphatase RPAP2 homolog n=1 Tax=Torulaspora globosa TaxID=48254 RepID=A0A7H9HQE4_9SACH|nr:hypothetical protein HG537_0C02270 [Torulaspora sp. CBS 2947]